MLKKTALALTALVVLTGLTGCKGDSPADLDNAKVETLTYRGENLTCLKQGIGDTTTRSCDFDGFYAAHPRLLAQTSEHAEDGVKWTSYQGKPLACIKKGVGKTQTRSCDFRRYHASHAN